MEVKNRIASTEIIQPRRSSGLTLIELLVAIAIITVILSLGVPKLDRLVQSTRLDSVSRELLGAIQLARSEAIMRGTSVSMCPSLMWKTGVAECSGSYSAGWIVFINPDRDNQVDSPSEQVVGVYGALRQGYSITNRLSTRAITDRVTYRSDGSSYRNLTLQVCSPDPGIPSTSIVLNIVGRARLDRGWGECHHTV
jgi:type IV fimbrial biogenesis protein FimT